MWWRKTHCVSVWKILYWRIRKKKKSITFWKKYSMNDVICPCRFRWSFMKKKNPNTGKMQISRCRMKWKMSFVCPVLVQNVILKENIWRVRKQVHRKYHGRPGRLLQSLRRKQLRQRRRKLRRPKRKPCQQERSLQNRKNTVVSERILAAAGISGSGVLLNVLTIRM